MAILRGHDLPCDHRQCAAVSRGDLRMFDPFCLPELTVGVAQAGPAAQQHAALLVQMSDAA